MPFNVMNLSDLDVAPEQKGLLWVKGWTDTTIKYSFSDFEGWAEHSPSAVNSQLQIKIENVLDQVARVTNLTFQSVSSDAHIDFFINGTLEDRGAAGYALAPNSGGNYASFANQEISDYTIYQETLHALGLSSPDNDILPLEYQSGFLTVMYSGAPDYGPLGLSMIDPNVTGLLAADIEALQAIYGVNQASSGKDTYRYNTSDEIFEGLFDAGGYDTVIITDPEEKGVSIDLTPGAGWDVGYFGIVYDPDDPQSGQQLYETVHTTSTTIIEKVIAAEGHDYLKGNSVDNILVGKGGDDTLLGDDGNDILRGQDGVDSISGDAGNDQLWGGDGNDLLFGGAGDDTIGGGTGDDLIETGSGKNTVYAAGGDDTIDGSEGTKAGTLWAGDGDDSMLGGVGADRLGTGAGADTVYAGAGNDTLYGSDDDSSDFLNGEAGNDVIYGGAGDDVLVGGAGNDTVSGGRGDDRLVADRGDDVLTGGAGSDTFVIYGQAGSVAIQDFDTSVDLLDLGAFGDALDTIQELQERATEVEGGVTISLDADTEVFLANISLAEVAEIILV